jgi:hypothetical protein
MRHELHNDTAKLSGIRRMRLAAELTLIAAPVPGFAANEGA